MVNRHSDQKLSLSLTEGETINNTNNLAMNTSYTQYNIARNILLLWPVYVCIQTQKLKWVFVTLHTAV